MEFIKQLIALYVFYKVVIILIKFYQKKKEGSKSDLGASSGINLMNIPDAQEASDIKTKGRQRKPSKNWLCTRCGTSFVLPIDPATVPIPWWFGEATKPFSNKNPCPWACPNCGTYAYTVPI